MIGAIAGAAVGIGSSIFGGIKSARAARKAKRRIEQSKRDNEAWYNRRYNEDATQRADAQRILRKTQDAIRERNRQAAATQAVTGGSEESVAATREANANALADTASAINANADARKDQIEQQYRARANELDDKLVSVDMQRSQNIANAASQAVKSAASIASSLDSAETTKASSAPVLSDAQKSYLDAKMSDYQQSIFDDARQASDKTNYNYASTNTAKL